jgi:hypothetical protein
MIAKATTPPRIDMIVPKGIGGSPLVFCKFLEGPVGKGLDVILSMEEVIARFTVENTSDEEVTTTEEATGLAVVVVMASSVVVEVLVALALVVIEGIVEAIPVLSVGFTDI